MFRIYIYLSIYNFIKSFLFVSTSKNQKYKISQIILNQSKKKRLVFSSQCRVAFLYLLKFFRKEDAKKNEIIFCAYNLPEMVNVAKNLNFKIKFYDLNYQNGFIDLTGLRKQITRKTKAIVLTNMFNDFKYSMKIKEIAKKKKLYLIEDNAIYFDNYTKQNNNKYYSGSIGDFSIYSFNIMKNLSGMYGGAIATNNHNFINFFNNEDKKNSSFYKIKFLQQTIIFIILKIMSSSFFYKRIFFYIIKRAHKKKIKFLLKLFYPSTKFKIVKFPKYYFTKISDLTITLVYLQIINFKKRKDLFEDRKRKNIYYYKNLSKIKNDSLNLIKIKDFNYQNFLDFPILIKEKEKLNLFLFNKGIETKLIHYKNCENIFTNKKLCKNSSLFEKRLLCLPNHKKITYDYIDKIIKNIKIFLNKH